MWFLKLQLLFSIIMYQNQINSSNITKWNGKLKFLSYLYILALVIINFNNYGKLSYFLVIHFF